MISKRDVLRNIGAVGGIVAIAGCGEQEVEAEPEEDPEEEQDDEQADSDTEESGLDQIGLQFVEFRYGFSSGLVARVNLQYQAPDGSARTYVRIEAYDGDTLIGNNSVWENLGAGRTTEIELGINELGSLEDYDIDDVTEFVIIGRREGGEDTEIESFTGDEVRDRLEEE